MVDCQFERIYEETKDFGRTQFVREIQMQINSNKKLERENKQLKERIDKAIEYIEKASDWEWENLAYGDLLEILKGESNE